MNTDLYDYPMIAFPRPEKNALIIGGKCQTVKELWSGTAGSNGRGALTPNSSPPLILQAQQINI